MGAWGSGPFDNDDACDWAFELEEGGVKYIKATLQTVTKSKPDEYVEAPECSNAIAAAEVVAAMNGQGLKKLPEEVSDWLGSKPKLSPELKSLALAAIDRIGSKSELKELWDEAKPDDKKQWYASLKDLTNRLG